MRASDVIIEAAFLVRILLSFFYSFINTVQGYYIGCCSKRGADPVRNARELKYTRDHGRASNRTYKPKMLGFRSHIAYTVKYPKSSTKFPRSLVVRQFSPVFLLPTSSTTAFCNMPSQRNCSHAFYTQPTVSQFRSRINRKLNKRLKKKKKTLRKIMIKFVK